MRFLRFWPNLVVGAAVWESALATCRRQYLCGCIALLPALLVWKHGTAVIVVVQWLGKTSGYIRS